jgi:ATP-binding cassette, subfamily B, bacterial
VQRAMTHAQADEFVMDLPAGIDTIVGERGVTLSGGQRQRVALARAFASPSWLLLVDDATSSLDPSTEGRVLAALPEALQGGSAIIVASRPSTIGLADQVAFMEDGRITAFGQHEDLLESVPAYRDLVEAYERDRA